MDYFDFLDRPTEKRVKATASAYYPIDPTLVLSFLNFQWTYRDMQRQYDKLLARSDLSESKFIILMFLKEADDYMLLPSVIAEKLGATRATATKLLRGMEKSGLIKKIPSTEDKRSVYIELTKRGQETLREIVPDNFASVETIFSFISVEEMQLLNQLLNKIQLGTKKLKEEMEK